MFWSSRPSLADREAILSAAGAADLRPVTEETAGPPWYDHLYLGASRPDGLMVEVVHSLTTATHDLMDATLHQFDPTLPALDTIKGIVDGQDIAGVNEHLVRAWQAMATPYPRQLQNVVIRRHGRIEQFWRCRMLTDRDNPVLLSRELFRVTNQMLLVLHALNGHYCGHPSAFKRLDLMATNLLQSPIDLSSRLRAIFTNPTRDGATVLHELVEETYDLVEQHLPDVDVESLRTIFRSDRVPLEAPPGRGATT